MGILLLLLVVSPSRAAQMFFAPALNFSVCVSFKSGMTQWHHLAVRGSGVPSDRIMPWLPERIQCGQYPFRPPSFTHHQPSAAQAPACAP